MSNYLSHKNASMRAHVEGKEFLNGQDEGRYKAVSSNLILLNYLQGMLATYHHRGHTYIALTQSELKEVFIK